MSLERENTMQSKLRLILKVIPLALCVTAGAALGGGEDPVTITPAQCDRTTGSCYMTASGSCVDEQGDGICDYSTP